MSATRDRVVLLLVNGMSVDAAETFCIRGGETPEAARQIVSEARARITVAADYTRDEQMGKAVIRLNDLYAKSVSAQDIRTALQSQREINRLLSLYSGSEREQKDGDDGQECARRLALIESYLIPLELVDPQYPVEEHARIAADVIRTNGLANRT